MTPSVAQVPVQSFVPSVPWPIWNFGVSFCRKSAV
jgi:hypothetical protein